jgi:hypothetical protein
MRRGEKGEVTQSERNPTVDLGMVKFEFDELIDLEVADGGGSAHMTATEHREVTLGLVEGMTGLAKAKQSHEMLLLNHEDRFNRQEKRINALERQREDESKSKSAGGFLGGIFS